MNGVGVTIPDCPQRTYEYPIADNESPSTAVVMAIHTITGQLIEDMPVLQKYVSADALDELCKSLSARGDDRGGYVTFPYCGFTVTITGTETVRLRDSDD